MSLSGSAANSLRETLATAKQTTRTEPRKARIHGSSTRKWRNRSPNRREPHRLYVAHPITVRAEPPNHQTKGFRRSYRETPIPGKFSAFRRSKSRKPPAKRIA